MPTTITAAVARAAGQPFSLETLTLEDPRDDEVLVCIHAVGVCHTDLGFRDGATGLVLPAVLGHEGAGVVEKVGGAVSKVRPGDRVGLSFRSCGACPNCARHLPGYCHSFAPLNFAGRRPDGSTALTRGSEAVSSHFFGQSSFASHALTSARNVVKLPDDLGWELAAPLGCGIQTGAGAIMNSLHCEAGSTVLVIGGGSVGLAAVMAARVQQCARVILLEPLAARRALALEIGATEAIDPRAGDVVQAVRALLPVGVDYAFDTTGRREMLDAAVLCLAPNGLLGVVAAGTEAGQTLPGNLGYAITFGLGVKGIIEGDADPEVFIPQLIDLYRAGRFPFDRLVRTFPFAAINEAIAAQHHGDCVKVVLTV